MVWGLVGRAGGREGGDPSYPLPYVCLLSVCTLRRCPGQPGKGWMTRRCQSGNTNCWGFVGICLGIGMTLNAGNVLQMQNWEISVQ